MARVVITPKKSPSLLRTGQGRARFPRSGLTDGCVECGTCRIIAEATGDIEWNYPRGGYGVSFKFG
jgi:ferredoxin-like protein FixX